MDKIIISKPYYKDKRLYQQISTPKELEKYFTTRDFFIEYDTDVSVDESLLNIPLAAIVLPFAWLTGYDIEVSSIDSVFNESMIQLKNEFKKFFPRIPFEADITAKKNVENRVELDEEEVGLLFSGGVDSTYSMIKNIERKPTLVMLWGIDNFAYPENSEQWQHIIQVYSKQAQRLGLKLHLIKTNASVLLDLHRINHDFHRMLHNGSFRGLLQHSLILLPLLAPLSIERFNRLIIASSGEAATFEEMYDNPWGSAPEFDEKITWADLRVEHHGTIDRAIKISGEVKDFLLENSLQLRVCLRKLECPQLNDSTCEKCLRTIASLILAGVDPNICGFHVDNSTFDLMKKSLTGRRVTNDLSYEWSPIQKFIPKEVTFDLYGSNEFFSWFKEYDLTVEEGPAESLRDVYHKLPYEAAARLDSVYRKMGVNIHEASPKRT